MIGVVPITTVLALLAAAVLLVVLVIGSRSRVTRPVTRSFWCAQQGRAVTVQFDEKTWDDRRVGVAACSAFDPPADVRCGRQCLALKRLPAAVGEPGIA